MREAVLLYDERVYRGEVLRGMNRIASNLGSLAGIMSSLRTDMDRIGRDVALMSDDISRVYEQNRSIASNASRQADRLCEETRLHRYTVEALARSNERLTDQLEQ